MAHRRWSSSPLTAWIGRRARSARCPATRSRRSNAIGFALWVGLVALASGAVAFALAPFVGRGAAAGIAGRRAHRRLLPQRLPGDGPRLRRPREPDLVRLDGPPPAARRPARLALAGARRRSSTVVLFAIGVEAFVAARPRGRRAASRGRRSRRPRSACADRRAGRSASGCRWPWPGGSASACSRS